MKLTRRSAPAAAWPAVLVTLTILLGPGGVGWTSAGQKDRRHSPVATGGDARHASAVAARWIGALTVLDGEEGATEENGSPSHPTGPPPDRPPPDPPGRQPDPPNPPGKPDDRPPDGGE